MSRFTQPFQNNRSPSKKQSSPSHSQSASQTSSQATPHGQNDLHNPKRRLEGIKLRPKPKNESPFEFTFVPEIYGLPPTYQYPYATKIQSRPELATPPVLLPKYNPLSNKSVGVGDDGDGIEEHEGGALSVKNGSLKTNDAPTLTPALSTSSHHSRNTVLAGTTGGSNNAGPNTPAATNITPSPPTDKPTSTTAAAKDVKDSKSKGAESSAGTKKERQENQSPAASITSTYLLLKDKLASLRDQESRLLQQAGSHNSVTQQEERKCGALSVIIHRVRQTRKLLLSRIASPRWEIPHHYHTTSLEHSLGRKQPNVMEVGELINGHLRIYAIARRTTLSQKILIYALNRAKKSKATNQERVRSITGRLKDTRVKLKELEELIVQVRRKGVELLNTIASVYFTVHYNSLNSASDPSVNVQTPPVPRALILNNGQITTPLVPFVNQIPNLPDQTRQELLKMVSLLNVDILSSQSGGMGGVNRDIRSSFFKQLHIAPVATTEIENDDLQLSVEDKDLVLEMLRTVRHEMGTAQNVNPNRESPMQFYKDVVLGEAVLAHHPITSNQNTVTSVSTSSGSSPPTISILSPTSSTGTGSTPSQFGTSPPSDKALSTSPTTTGSAVPTSSASVRMQDVSLQVQHGHGGGSSQVGGGGSSPPPSDLPAPTVLQHRFTTVDVLPQPSLQVDGEDDYETRMLSTGATCDSEVPLLEDASDSSSPTTVSSSIRADSKGTSERDSGSSRGGETGKGDTLSGAAHQGRNGRNDQAGAASTTGSSSASTASTTAGGSKLTRPGDNTASISPLSPQDEFSKDGSKVEKQDNDADFGLLTRSVSDLMAIQIDISQLHEELRTMAQMNTIKERRNEDDREDSGSVAGDKIDKRDTKSEKSDGGSQTSAPSSGTTPSSTLRSQLPPNAYPSPQPLLSQQGQFGQHLPQMQPPKRSSSQTRYRAHAPTAVYQIASSNQPHHAAHQPLTSSSIATTTVTNNTGSQRGSGVGSLPTTSALPSHPQYNNHPSSLPSQSSIPHQQLQQQQQQQQQQQTPSTPMTPASPQPLKVLSASGLQSPSTINVFGGGGYTGLHRKGGLGSLPVTTTTNSPVPSSHTSSPLTSPMAPNKLGTGKPIVVRSTAGAAAAGLKSKLSVPATTTIFTHSSSTKQSEPVSSEDSD